MSLIKPVCEICYEYCKIPVKFTCFPCYSHENIHCHSIKRFCLMCAEKYLEKNTSVKKCIYCDATTTLNINTFRIQDLYEKDFFIMSLDLDRYSCAHLDCDFTGTQSELNKHLSDCGYVSVHCFGCHVKVQRKSMAKHQEECTKLEKCFYCDTICLKNHLEMHVGNKHCTYRCFHCQTFIPENEMERHVTEICPHRPTICEWCHDIYPHSAEKPHLLSHLRMFHKGKVDLMEELNRLNGFCLDIQEKICHDK